MLVKTFWAGRVNGTERAYSELDRMVKEVLGEGATIHSVTDTAYGDTRTVNPGEEYGIARVVVYSPLYPQR